MLGSGEVVKIIVIQCYGEAFVDAVVPVLGQLYRPRSDQRKDEILYFRINISLCGGEFGK